MSRREPDPYDNLVWDSVGGLGWIDPTPEHFLASIGVTLRQSGDHFVYYINRDGFRQTFLIPRNSDFAVLRAVLDDAEMRAKGTNEGGTP